MFGYGEISCEVKLCLSLMLILILAGCADTNVGPETTAVRGTRHETVSEEAVAAFLETLETGNYHAAERSGEDIFLEGWRIPNHHRIFRDYPSEDLPNGQIRYDLLTIRGEAGAAWIHLFLEKDSGRIIQFSAGEAVFEGNS